MKARSKRIFEPPTPTFHAEENTHFKTIVTLYIQSRQQTEKRVFAFSRAQAYRIIVMTGRFFRLSENKGCDEQNFHCLTTSAGKSMPPLSFIWRVFATDQDTVIKPGIFRSIIFCIWSKISSDDHLLISSKRSRRFDHEISGLVIKSVTQGCSRKLLLLSASIFLEN